ALDEAEQLVGELREAARRAGLQRDDPLMPLLTAFVHAIRYLGARTAASDRTVAGASQRISDALLLARQVADAEADRFLAKMAATEAATVERIATAIAHSADTALTRRVRVFDRNTALLAALTLVATAAACLGGGYWWGSSRATAAIRETEVGLQAAFNDGPQDALTWLDLMIWNPIRVSIGYCSQPGMTHLQDGRKECDVPLWIEKPKPTAPGRG
ncbi:MAG: hypothetical protein M3Y41_14555, partial [Pseudomonadota bacterium]|nr:hypothetical protein [Pseudomonadota bacterium]